MLLALFCLVINPAQCIVEDNTTIEEVTSNLTVTLAKRAELRELFVLEGLNGTVNKSRIEDLFTELQRAEGDVAELESDLSELEGLYPHLRDAEKWCRFQMELHQESRAMLALQRSFLAEVTKNDTCPETVTWLKQQIRFYGSKVEKMEREKKYLYEEEKKVHEERVREVGEVLRHEIPPT